MGIEIKAMEEIRLAINAADFVGASKLAAEFLGSLANQNDRAGFKRMFAWMLYSAGAFHETIEILDGLPATEEVSAIRVITFIRLNFFDEAVAELRNMVLLQSEALIGDPGKRWNGELVPSLLVIASIGGPMGFGDVFQFSRFLVDARKRCERLVLLTRQSQLRIFGDLADEVVDERLAGSSLPAFDAYTELLLLPETLGMDDSYGQVPYLYAESSLAPSKFRRVGLCWTCSRAGETVRAMPFETMADLREVAGIEFHSLVPSCGASWLVSHDFLDWQQTAQIIAGLDLVITVDTAVAHVAGAMGKPVWIVLPNPSDWRWGTHPTNADWYPTATLFRTFVGESWREVIGRVKQSLRDSLN